MNKLSDKVTIRFFCIETNKWVSFWAPGDSGPKPSTLPLPPTIWSTCNVDLQSDYDDVQVGEGDEFNGPYETESETELCYSKAKA